MFSIRHNVYFLTEIQDTCFELNNASSGLEFHVYILSVMDIIEVLTMKKISQCV